MKPGIYHNDGPFKYLEKLPYGCKIEISIEMGTCDVWLKDGQKTVIGQAGKLDNLEKFISKAVRIANQYKESGY